MSPMQMPDGPVSDQVVYLRHDSTTCTPKSSFFPLNRVWTTVEGAHTYKALPCRMFTDFHQNELISSLTLRHISLKRKVWDCQGEADRGARRKNCCCCCQSASHGPPSITTDENRQAVIGGFPLVLTPVLKCYFSLAQSHMLANVSSALIRYLPSQMSSRSSQAFVTCCGRTTSKYARFVNAVKPLPRFSTYRIFMTSETMSTTPSRKKNDGQSFGYPLDPPCLLYVHVCRCVCQVDVHRSRGGLPDAGAL